MLAIERYLTHQWMEKGRCFAGRCLRGAFSVTRRLKPDVPLGNRKSHMGAPYVTQITANQSSQPNGHNE